MARLASWMPGRKATLATCSGAWSFWTCSISLSLAKISHRRACPACNSSGCGSSTASTRSSGPVIGSLAHGTSARQMSTITSASQPSPSCSTRQAVIGDRLHLVGEHVPRRVERFAPGGRRQAVFSDPSPRTGRTAGAPRRSGYSSSLSQSKSKQVAVGPGDLAVRCVRTGRTAVEVLDDRRRTGPSPPRRTACPGPRPGRAGPGRRCARRSRTCRDASRPRKRQGAKRGSQLPAERAPCPRPARPRSRSAPRAGPASSALRRSPRPAPAGSSRPTCCRTGRGC